MAAPQLRRFWHERNPRERRLLLIMALVVSLALLWLLLDWLAAERQRLDKLLPRMHAQVLAMQDDAAELARLRATVRRPPQDSTQLVEALKSQAAAQNLPLSVRADGERITVSGNKLSFDTWIDWLASTQAQNSLRVHSLEAVPDNGGQRIELRFSPTQQAQ